MIYPSIPGNSEKLAVINDVIIMIRVDKMVDGRVDETVDGRFDKMVDSVGIYSLISPHKV